MQRSDALRNIVSARKPILFLGAGFSNQAQNLLGHSVPSSKQLCKRIFAEIQEDVDGEVPLSLAVDRLREKRFPSTAYEFLINQLTTKGITDEQKEILSLPWHRIYTTNIDNIGSKFSGRAFVDAAIDDRNIAKGEFVYLHGELSGCTPNNYYKRVKMGGQLYVAGARSGSKYHHLLNQDLYESDVVIVLGYSMSDPDLSNIFFNSPDLINKCWVYSGDTSFVDSHRIALIGADTKLKSADFLTELDTRKNPRAFGAVMIQ